ncbi:DUF2637 domain-containing protein [Streptomyces tagetis]|uniref:DUF2637 domain-containing protein n=1 Tax=Streptomyces tagetis TaxID=2820809 RepID=A0A940XK09_9ACTN|nr:DUF2637 domain-containing protein [Streptomyces sp. RG38]
MVVFGAVIIAGIGFAGSYAAVRELALQKGFGNFSYVFPIGIDAGICVLLALDLLLTWIRIPFPLLRQTAWLLTMATIAFNGAAAWPDPLGVGMHAVIPVLFVVSVEAARHAIGRIADITADKHMEGVRLTRWLLSPVPTFLLWRRMKLWELRSYDQVIKLEQERLVYQARLRSRFGRAWRRKAPVESLMPLRLARYGVPLAETAPAGLAAAGIEPALLPPAPEQTAASVALTAQGALGAGQPLELEGQRQAAAGTGQGGAGQEGAGQGGAVNTADAVNGVNSANGAAGVNHPNAVNGVNPANAVNSANGTKPVNGTHPDGTVNPADPVNSPAPGTPVNPADRNAPVNPADSVNPGAPNGPATPATPGGPEQSPWFNTRRIDYQGGYDPAYNPAEQYAQWYEQQRHADEYRDQYEEEPPLHEPSPEETGSFPIPVVPGRTRELGEGGGTPEPDEDAYYQVFKQSIDDSFPTPREFGENIQATFGTPLPDTEAKRLVTEFSTRFSKELEEDHIA